MNNKHEYVDWYEVKDPHPAALTNLNRLVSYMVAKGHIHNAGPVTPYRLAKDLGKHPKQIASLIKDRPGFIQLIRDGNSLGYYWDKATFGDFYPQTYSGHRGRKLLAVESANANEIANVKALNDNLPAMARQLRAEVNKPDLELPAFGEAERVTSMVKFSLLPVEIAKDMLQTAVRNMADGKLNDDDATDILTSLLSLSAHSKDKNV